MPHTPNSESGGFENLIRATARKISLSRYEDLCQVGRTKVHELNLLNISLPTLEDRQRYYVFHIHKAMLVYAWKDRVLTLDSRSYRRLVKAGKLIKLERQPMTDVIDERGKEVGSELEFWDTVVSECNNDDRSIHVIRMLLTGYSFQQISNIVGLKRNVVENLCNRVAHAVRS